MACTKASLVLLVALFHLPITCSIHLLPELMVAKPMALSISLSERHEATPAGVQDAHWDNALQMLQMVDGPLFGWERVTSHNFEGRSLATRPMSSLQYVEGEVWKPVILRSVTLLVGTALLFLLFNNWRAEIQMRTAIRVEHVCIVAYAGLSISIDLSIKSAANANGGHYAFNPACAVVTVECIKMVISGVLFAWNAWGKKSGGEKEDGVEIILPGWRDAAWLMVPGFVYTCNNIIVFKAIGNAPLGAFGVIRETMLIWNALLWSGVFGTSIGRVRWLAIIVLFLACIVNQLPAFFRSEFTWGVAWAFLLAFSNAAGAVANEFAMKRKAAMDINLQNLILYFFCGGFGLLYLMIFCQDTLQRGFFDGFGPPCIQVVLLQVLTGLAVSRILKYVDAVTKTIVAALRGPGVIFLGAMIFQTALHMNEIVATIVVCAACFVYLAQGPLTRPPTESK